MRTLDSWATARLDQACSKVTDGTHHSPPNGPDGDYRYVTAKNIRPWGLDLSDITFVTAEVHDEIYARCPPEKGDVLYIKDGVTTGLAAVNTLDEPFSMLSSVALLKPERGLLDSSYLKHWLNSPETFRTLTGKMSGSAIRRIVLRQLRQAEVQIPPLNEQRRIVAKIDALQARSRKAREALDAVPALLDRFRQSVLAAAFRGDLTADWRAKNPDVEPATVLLARIRAERKERWIAAEVEKTRARAEARAKKKGKPWSADDDAKAVAAAKKKVPGKYKEPEPVDAEVEGLPELPEGWCWATLNEVSSRVSVGHVGPTSQHYTTAENGVTFLRSQNVRPGRLELAGVRYITHAFHESLGKSALQPGDLLVVRVGANRGDTAVLSDGHGKVNCANIVFARTPPRVANFLEAYCQSRDGRDQLLGLSTGSAQGVLNTKSVAELRVPLAPLPEQDRLLRLLMNAAVARKNIKTHLESGGSRLNTLDQSILAKAFRGELVPQDPNDEPASLLLERIKAEREAAAPKKKESRKSKAKSP